MLKLGSVLEATPAYRAAVARQQAKEDARLHPEKITVFSTYQSIKKMVDQKLAVDHLKKSDCERERLHLWLLNAEYNSEKPIGAAIVEFNARKHNLTVDDIKGDSRFRNIIAARYDAIVDLHHKRPELSLPEMGRIMGGRDHTTILHALRKRGIAYKPRHQTFDPDQARTLYASGMTNEEVALAMDYAVETVRRATSPLAQGRSA
ncbi:chromosomal replication initiation ATPase DnaA [Phyllobacterium trifolii]|uniref:Chromosomal replication initiation ATPase DnaA n=1 Tax=Phyllobacterium trifolii TaxID=300193 RepID=A0A839U4N7_9HYPH|nr:helix-turn-helix domain-containing protein [Phyllobacterium trifolii]MBB3144903.1 chromosomal replication initiation ATPase DnaA [Phyllobacterium trifolii]